LRPVNKVKGLSPEKFESSPVVVSIAKFPSHRSENFCSVWIPKANPLRKPPMIEVCAAQAVETARQKIRPRIIPFFILIDLVAQLGEQASGAGRVDADLQEERVNIQEIAENKRERKAQIGLIIAKIADQTDPQP